MNESASAISPATTRASISLRAGDLRPAVVLAPPSRRIGRHARLGDTRLGDTGVGQPGAHFAQMHGDLVGIAALLDLSGIDTRHRTAEPVLAAVGVDPLPDVFHLSLVGAGD